MQYRLTHIRKGGFSGISRYSNTTVRVGPSLSASTGDRYTGLTKDDETELEEALRMQPGTLSPKSDYWITFHVPVPVEGLRLDTEENPEHKLWVKFLKKNTLVADGVNNLSKSADAEFLLTSDIESAEVHNEGRKWKKEAYVLFSKLTPSDMRGLLLIMGKPSQSTVDSVVEDQLGSEMEADYKKFVELASDEKLKYKIFVTKAVGLGIITRSTRSNSADFYFKEVFLGHGISEAVDFLTLKTNVEVYTGIKKEMSTAMNTKEV